MSNPFELINIINLPSNFTSPISADGKHIWVAKESVSETPVSEPKIVYKLPYDNPSNYSIININTLTYMYGAISSNGTYLGVLGQVYQTVAPQVIYYVSIMKCDDPQNTQFLVQVPFPCNAITLDSKYVWCSSAIKNTGEEILYISKIYKISFAGIILSTISLNDNSNILSLSSDGTNLWAATFGRPTTYPLNSITKISCNDVSYISTIDLGVDNYGPVTISSDGTNVWVGVAGYSEPTPNKVIKISCSSLNTSEISMVSVPTSVSSNGTYVFVSCVNTDSASENNGVYLIDCATSSILEPVLSENTIPNINSVAYNGKYGWSSDRGLNGLTILYQYGISSYLPQLEDPFNINYVAPGVKSNGLWTKAITTSYNPLKQNWSSVATSSDGKFVLACVNGGQIYSSSNYGYDLQPESSSILPSSASWSCIKISPDGSKAVACINNTSSNGGVYTASLIGTSWTWTKSTLESTNWSSVSFSGDSLNIATVISNLSQTNPIYIGTQQTSGIWTWVSIIPPFPNTSPDQKVLWSSITNLGTQKDFVACIHANSNNSITGIYALNYNNNTWILNQINTNNSNWTSICCNLNGNIIYVCNSSSSSLTLGIYKLVYNNPSWIGNSTSAPTPKAWTSIATDSTGQYVVACVNGGGLYSSIDYGNSWQEQTTGLPTSSLWTCVAIATNSSGSFLLGCAQNDYIYISPYFQGYQWNSSINNPAFMWSYVASNSTGQKLIALTVNVNTSGSIYYISNDFGITWKQNIINPTQNWVCATINDDGLILGVCSDYGNSNLKNCSISLDGGINWNLISIGGGVKLTQISFDSSGTYGVTCSEDAGIIYLNKNIPNNINLWEDITPPSISINRWTSIHISGDNRYCFVCFTAGPSGIYKGSFDTDHSITWIQSYTTEQAIYFNSITSSTNGQYIVACNYKYGTLIPSQLWISNDNGENWSNPSGFPLTTNQGYGFQSVTISNDGKKIAAVAYYTSAQNSDGNVYFSFDSGKTWISQINGLPVTRNYWSGIATNSNMTKLVLSSKYTGYGSSGVFTGFLSESCWTPQLNAVPTRNAFTKLTSSNNGKYLAVVAENQSNIGAPNNDYGGIWISWNNGSTWFKSDAGNFCWNAIASDNTGQYLVAGVYGGQIYTSSNYGLNWIIQSSSSGLPTSANWCALSFSNNSDPNSTSQYVYAAVASDQTYPGYTYDGGYIYLSTNRGLTWTPLVLFTTWGNGIASSSNGEFMYVGALTNPNTSTNPPASGIYGSYNYGAKTLDMSLNLIFVADWNYVATDSTGKYTVAVNENKLTTNDDDKKGIWLGISNLQSPPTVTWYQIASKALKWNSITLVNMVDYLLISAVCTNGLVYTCNYNINSQPPAFLNGFFTSPSETSNTFNELFTVNYNTNNPLVDNSQVTNWKTNCVCNGTGSTDTSSYILYICNGNFINNSINLNPPLPQGVTQYLGFEGSSNGPTAYLSIDQDITFTSIGSCILSFYVAPANPDSQYANYNPGNNEITITVSNNVLSEQVTINPNIWNWIKKSYTISIPIAGSYKFTFKQNITGSYSSSSPLSIFFVTGFELAQVPNTWTLQGGLPASQWNDIKSSILPTGDVQLIMCSTNGGIWKSTDSGATWTQSVLPENEYKKVLTSSSTGQNLAAIVNNGFLYNSTDYGSTWNPLPNSLPLNTLYMPWNSITSSITGQYIYASTIIGEIYKSQNYGKTWNKSVEIYFYPILSMSSSGQYIAAASNGGSIYLSSDYGSIWTQLTTVNGLPSISESWSAISLSATGQYMAASINNGNIYKSSDYGSTWNNINLISGTWSSIAIADSGKYIVASMNEGAIYGSSDFGFSLSEINSSVKNWSSISISGTGQYITASTNDGKVFSSSNFGLAWIPIYTTTANLFNSITSSKSGQYLATIGVNAATSSETDIYIYSNYMDIGNIYGTLINQLQILIQP